MRGKPIWLSPDDLRTERPAYWTKIFSELYGPVRVDAQGAKTIQGRIACADLWRVKLCRVALGRHRITLPPALARPGTHLLNKVHFQTQGKAIFEQDGRTILLEPGDCLVYQLTWPHVFTSLDMTSYDAVIAPNDLIRRQTVPVEMLRARKISGDDKDDTANFAHSIVKTVLQDSPKLPQAAAASVAQALLSLLNVFFSQGIVGADGFTRSAMMREQAKTYIEDHLREADLSVEQISAALGCSKRYLHTIFREDGTSVQRYIWRARIERCRAELESPASAIRTITDVAFSWGFSSASHFTRLFKSSFGVLPSAVRLQDRAQRPGAE